jgi:uncharacterized protein (DUF1330 family)
VTAYAIAHIRELTFNDQIREYLERIDATLAPFSGRFLVHGGNIEEAEGSWPGHLVILEFPDRDHARAWYDSPAYQEILPLRTRNSEGAAILVDGVPGGYRATDMLTP